REPPDCARVPCRLPRPASARRDRGAGRGCCLAGHAVAISLLRPPSRPQVAAVWHNACVTCPACGTPRRPGARFCAECGARLDTGCPSCGAAVSPDQKFCAECGTRLSDVAAMVPAAAAAPRPEPRFAAPSGYTPPHLVERILKDRAALMGERKQVTVLFADV